jgi:hypothetical protein
MLKTLRIRNLVTIEDLEVDFAPGLNVLTGETGAGKSIVVDAVGLAAGGRGDSGVVRSGAERAVVEAAFSCGQDSAAARAAAVRGIDAADGEIGRAGGSPVDGPRLAVRAGAANRLRAALHDHDVWLEVSGRVCAGCGTKSRDRGIVEVTSGRRRRMATSRPGADAHRQQ